MRRSSATFVAPLLLAASSFGQGADNCASAQGITGTGLFPFSNVGATDDGPPLAGCTAAIHQDVWWAWTAPSTGTFYLTTCGQAAFDTVLAVYAGTSCPPGADIACNDDTCALQSSLTFGATAGALYLIRAGSYAVGTTGTGSIRIFADPGSPANDCASATAITGTGSFPFSNIGATTDGPPLVLCSGVPCNSDVWWTWTAPSTGPYLIRTCGLSALDTVLVVYSTTSCPASNEIGCSDDACGLQSLVPVSTTAGAAYLVRLGSFSASAQGAGYLEILLDPCIGASDDGMEENDDCSSALAINDGSYPDLFVHKSDEDWYRMTVDDGATLTIDAFFSHASGDIDIALWDGCGGVMLALDDSVDDDEKIVWTNGTGAALDVYLDVYVYAGSGNDCNGYDLQVQGSSGSGVGTKYCTANANSTGAPADLSASGSASSAAGNLTLEALPVPNQNGIFFHGQNQVQVAFGNGFLCAAGNIVRGAVVLGAGNQASYVYDNSDAKHSLAGQVGLTRNFQYWFRDPMGGGALYNTSNGMAIAILP